MNLLFKALRVFKRKASLARKGYLISLIGVNGSGKSTTGNSLSENYLPLTNFASGQYDYYFGWKKSIAGNIIFKITPKSGHETKKLFDSVSEEKIKSFDIFQELLFVYIYCSFLFRYGKYIYPHLRKNELVMTDRYFYDLYGQYPYSQRSIMLKILPIPKPDKLVVLDADIETVLNRDKGGTMARIAQPKEKLEGQRKRYLVVGERNRALIINANEAFDENISIIINDTWKDYLRCK